MNLKFVLNDYVFIWNLLFQASVNSDIHAFKQKLWKNYRHCYEDMFTEKNNLLKDPKNYIPNDDTIYDMIKKTDMYRKIYDETELFRLSIMEVWDQNKKEIMEILKSLLRIDIKIYHVLVVHPKLDIVEMEVVKNRRVNTIVYGRKRKGETPLEVLVQIISSVLKKEIKSYSWYQEQYREFVDAVVELLIDNEFYTRLSKESKYLRGDPTLSFLKKQIYPYLLMYLGATRSEFPKYMKRDKIAFDINLYRYESFLASANVLEFIRFCIQNQRKIIQISRLEIR